MVSALASTALSGFQTALQLVHTLQLYTVFWPPQAQVKDGASYDFIIVGGGAAGCVLANRLTEIENIQVLVIEAGGDPPIESDLPGVFPLTIKTKVDWNFKSENDGVTFQTQKDKALRLTSGKLLGGSSSIEHLIYARGDPFDYEAWVKAADESWSWDSLLPYFKKSEKLEDPDILNSPTAKEHGTDGYWKLKREPHQEVEKYKQAFKEQGNEIILDPNANHSLGFFEPLYMTGGGLRQSMAQSFIQPIEHRTNLHILKNTFANRLIFDEDNKTVIGVEVTLENKNEISLFAKNEVIVSAGAIMSPKLLMLSGIGPADHLKTLNISVKADLPVGKNLQDHYGIFLLHRMTEVFTLPIKPSDIPNPFGFPGILLIGNAALNKTQNHPDYQTFNVVVPPSGIPIVLFCSIIFGLDDKTCDRMFSLGVGSEALYTLLVLLRPKSQGIVEIRSTNPKDPPKIYPNTFSDDSDMKTMIDSVKDFIKVGNTDQFKKLGGQLKDLDLPECVQFEKCTDEFWRCLILARMVSAYHYSGTSALGSVVDTRLKVFGIDNLRVVDAGNMPTSVSGDINAAVLAIAEKAADMIKDDHNLKQK